MIDAFNTLNAVSTFILAVLTGVYVFLTRRLLQETQRINDNSRQALERQFRLQTFPQLFCQLTLVENRLAVTVVNSSNNIAYDVDVVVVTVWTEGEMTIVDFLSKYVHPDHHDVAPRVSADGFYGVFDRSWYPLFRTRSKVSLLPPPQSVGRLSIFSYSSETVSGRITHSIIGLPRLTILMRPHFGLVRLIRRLHCQRRGSHGGAICG